LKNEFGEKIFIENLAKNKKKMRIKFDKKTTTLYLFILRLK
jgi:hypothetical protein